MNSTDMPSSAEGDHEPLDLGLGADVDAAGRLVEDEQLRLGGQPAGEQHLLLVAAAEGRDRLLGVRRAGCRSASMYLLDDLVLPPARDRARPAARGLERQDDVLAHGEVGDDALRLAVLGAEGEARADRARGVSKSGPPCRRWSRAAGRRGRRRRAVGRSRSGRSPAGRRGRDLARVDLRGRTARSPLAAERLGLEERRRSARAPLGRARGRSSSALASDSRPSILVDELDAGRARRSGTRRRASVAEHRDSVADLVHLVEEVRDEDDRHPLALSWRMTPNSCSTSCRSRLEVGSSRMSTLASMSSRGRWPPSAGPPSSTRHERRADVEVERGTRSSRLGGAPVHRPPLDRARVAGLAADEHVLGDRQVGAEVDLLVDGADAGLLGLERARGVEPGRPSSDDLPASGA